MPEKLKSRKFWFALLGALMPVAAQFFSEALQLSAAVVAAYLFGQGYVDGKAVEGAPPPAPEEKSA